MEIFRNISKIGLLENISDRLREIKETLESIQNILPTTTTTTTTTRTRPTRTTTTRLRVWNFSLFKLKTFFILIQRFWVLKRSTRSTRPKISAENLGPIQDIIDQILEKFNGTIDVPKTCLIWDEIWSPGLPFSISSPKQMCFAGPVLDIIALLVFGFKGFRIGF